MIFVGFALSMCSKFEFSRVFLSSPRYFTCLLDLQDVQWIRRLIMVRVNWPKHPKL